MWVPGGTGGRPGPTRIAARIPIGPKKNPAKKKPSWLRPFFAAIVPRDYSENKPDHCRDEQDSNYIVTHLRSLSRIQYPYGDYQGN